MTQSLTPHEALTDRFSAIFAGFRATVIRFGHHHRAAMPLVTILLFYFQRAAARFARAAARPPVSAKLPRDPAPETIAPDCAAPDPAPLKPRRARQSLPFPTKFAWLLHLMPTTPTTGVLAAQTRHDLIAYMNDPNVIELLAARPGLGRILRLLCRIFGIETPTHLTLRPRPKPKRKPRAYLWPRPLAPEDIHPRNADDPEVSFGPGSRFWPPRRKYRENFG